MSFLHTIRMGWGNGARSLDGNKNYSGGHQVSLDEDFAADASDLELTIAIDVSEIKAIFMVSDQDVQVETNDGAAPDDTIDLVANVPYIWTTDSYDSCLLTVDITALFLTQLAATAGTLKLECVVDPTP